jgi:hypothetical protein
MPTPGSPEWHAKVAAMRAAEALEPEQWFYLSFVDDVDGRKQFLGACVVRARGHTTAIDRAHSLGINPGGEVMSLPTGQARGPLPINRLLSKAEMEAIDGPGKTVGELEDRGLRPGPHVKFLD